MPVGGGACDFCDQTSEGFRIQSAAVLLTYNGDFALSTWPTFVKWVEANLRGWGAKYHCYTLETCRRGRLHFHLMLQFPKPIDRSSVAFAFMGAKPNARPSTEDYCKQQRSRTHA